MHLYITNTQRFASEDVKGSEPKTENYIVLFVCLFSPWLPDFHSIVSILWESMATSNSLVINIL